MGVWDTVSNFISGATGGFGGGSLDWFYASQNAVINQTNKATQAGLSSIESTINSTAGGVVNSVKDIAGQLSAELQEDYMNLYKGQYNVIDAVTASTANVGKQLSNQINQVRIFDSRSFCEGKPFLLWGFLHRW
jgi:hypothetical protein